MRCCGSSTSPSAPTRWTWQPMIWIVAILTMVVGSVLAMTQTDIKRMLAYSSIAHAGFLLTGVLGVRAPATWPTARSRSLQAVLFYLVTYGFMTLGAFAVVTLVRDAGGEADAPVALGGAGQGVAARGRRLRVLPARHGRHPADQRASPASGRSSRPRVGRRLAGRGGRGADQRGGGVLLRPGDRADVLLRARSATARRVTHARACSPPRPSPSGVAATLVLGIVPGPVLDLAAHAGEFIR